MFEPIIPIEEVDARLALCKDVFERFEILNEYSSMLQVISADYHNAVGRYAYMELQVKNAEQFKVKAALYDTMMEVFNKHPELVDDWHALLVKAKLVNSDIEADLNDIGKYLYKI